MKFQQHCLLGIVCIKPRTEQRIKDIQIQTLDLEQVENSDVMRTEGPTS